MMVLDLVNQSMLTEGTRNTGHKLWQPDIQLRVETSTFLKEIPRYFGSKVATGDIPG